MPVSYLTVEAADAVGVTKLLVLFLGIIMLLKCRSNHFGILKGQFKG